MTFDPLTLQAANAIVVIACSLGFVLNTLLRSFDRTGLYFAAGFLTALFSSIAFATAAVHTDIWAPIAVGNAMYVMSAGSLWSGMRTFTGRSSLFPVVLAAAAASAAWVPVTWAVDGAWAGAEAYLLSVSVFFILGGLLALRAVSRRSLHARIFGITMTLVGLYFFARTIALFVLGRENLGADAYFGTLTATSVVTMLLVICSVSLSALRSERETLQRRELDASPYSDVNALGALDSATFANGGADRMERASLHGVRVGLLHTRLEGLGDYNIIYGRSAGDEAIVRYARLLRRAVPPTALIGHRGGGGFAILVMLDVVTTSRDVGTAIISALAEEPLDTEQSLRFGVSIGIATAPIGGAPWDLLTDAAESALEKAQLIGGNAIVEWELDDSISLRHDGGPTLDA